MVSPSKLAFFSSFVPAVVWAAGISYSVEFEGLNDSATIKALKSSSQLIALRKKNPPSINALRFRADSDIPDLTRVLKAHGYLEASIEMQLLQDGREYLVKVMITPGPLYRIEQFRILFSTCDHLTLLTEELGITIGSPANTKKIIDAELCALQLLSERGYPLAQVENREILADGKTHRVKILLTINPGIFCRFGPTSIDGNRSVLPYLIEQQIRWCQHDPYNSYLVENTQQALMGTGLFSSVFITHAKEPDEGILPMKIEVCETKHKSVSLGASYQTTFGPGATIAWENRNLGGLGRKLTIQADLAQKSHSGLITYLIPNLHKLGQNYVMQAQAWHESIKPYTMQSYSFLQRLDRQVNPQLFFSIGPKIEYMMVTNSVDNGNFLLVEAPIYARYTNVEDPLNPLKGGRIEYRASPAINCRDTSDFYYSQTLTLCGYAPVWKKDRLILAQKLTLGTIFSNGLDAVPVPKRFFGGSEENLRGYKYYTVSPLNDRDKPIGGRSAVFYTLEPRFRITDSFGLVPFFDLGNVYLNELPTFQGKWRKSTGIGLRYYSFLGPLRLDVAFPLNRREGIDPHWWVFVSLGQTF